MGKGIRYSGEFKQEAVNQVVVYGYIFRYNWLIVYYACGLRQVLII
ncbi:hypothetical protein KCM76_23265 [Zooshikella marina]|nr:hypothetical protein [Zooshikella ganghwensis]MBU2708934.1 hypothetical protein [Zooshikella ganghwensis]